MMTLRLHIDGTWTAIEFADFFAALQDLSNKYHQLDHQAPHNDGSSNSPDDQEALRNLLRMQNAALRVQQISFSSPGWTDLTGAGAVIKEIREFLQFVVDRIIYHEDRKLDRELKRLAIEEAKLRITSEIDGKDAAGGKQGELASCDSLDKLIEAVIDGRLKRVTVFEAGETS